MAKLIADRCDYLFLPRPWLEKAAPMIRRAEDVDRDAVLYVRGDALIGGRTVRLAYWHKVVWVGNLES